jgi:hypothetical protein
LPGLVGSERKCDANRGMDSLKYSLYPIPPRPSILLAVVFQDVNSPEVPAASTRAKDAGSCMNVPGVCRQKRFQPPDAGERGGEVGISAKSLVGWCFETWWLAKTNPCEPPRRSFSALCAATAPALAPAFLVQILGRDRLATRRSSRIIIGFVPRSR